VAEKLSARVPSKSNRTRERLREGTFEMGEGEMGAVERGDV
jgi:hypothetical protein